jgi:hypothetical protein
MNRINLPALIALGLALVVVDVLATVAHAQIQVCPGIAPDSVYSACPKIQCGIPSADTDIVLTRVAGLKRWNRWNTVPPSGELVNCAVSPPVWFTRAQSGISVTPPAAPPVAPPAIGAGLDVTWAQPERGDITGYRLYVGTEPDTYGEPIDVGLTQSWPIAGTLEPGVYFFRVAAYGPAGEGPKSPEASTLIFEPDVPKALQCVAPVVTGLTVTMTCTLQ